jgi:predicted TIM-barrel fold metal-dependent hydrolase
MGQNKMTPIIDAHAHFFPQRLFEAIWAHFEGRDWPIAHKGDVDGLPGRLLDHGVAGYTVLNYVSKAGQAKSLNEWTRKFCEERPEAIPFCTLHVDDPDPWGTVAPYLEKHGFKGIKIQPLVCEFGVDDERLAPVLSRLVDLEKILVVHAGTAPRSSPRVGLERLTRALERHPGLKVILPHMGAYEVGRAFELLDQYPDLYLDTTMTFVDTDLFDTHPDVEVSLIEEFSDRILFGSDFPNVPYPYTEALDSITRLGLTELTVEKLFFKNAARLFDFRIERAENAAFAG